MKKLSTKHLSIEEDGRGGWMVMNNLTQWVVLYTSTREQCEVAIKGYSQGYKPRWDDMP